MDLIMLMSGIIIGAIMMVLYFKLRVEKNKALPNEQVNSLMTQVSILSTEKAKSEEKGFLLESSLQSTNSELANEREKVVKLSSLLSKANADLENLNGKLSEQKQELIETQSRLATEFKNLANEIFDDKSQRFTLQNKENIEAILTPLQQRIREFEAKVSDVYVKESNERASLAEQIKQLTTLNQQITKEAENLTTALKGQSKTQGDWGELILEEILEKSGLVKGTHYVVQQAVQGEDGKPQRPDVLINLPDNKNIIIDSKVSLTAYTEFSKTDKLEPQKDLLSKHIESIRKHIKELSNKKYQNIYELQSLDFVLMFVPIEPAFVLAVKNDDTLFNDAFDKNIVIVTTSTLLATLRTIASIWKQENQSRNAIEIARKSGELYDKFVSFVEDLNNVGDKILASQKAYEDAKNKLVTGRGNILRRTEELKIMGAKASKSLPPSLVSQASENDQIEQKLE